MDQYLADLGIDLKKSLPIATPKEIEDASHKASQIVQPLGGRIAHVVKNNKKLKLQAQKNIDLFASIRNFNILLKQQRGGKKSCMYQLLLYKLKFFN